MSPVEATLRRSAVARTRVESRGLQIELCGGRLLRQEGQFARGRLIKGVGKTALYAALKCDSDVRAPEERVATVAERA